MENKTDVDNITVKTTSLSMMVGETVGIEFTVTPTGANTASVVWESADPSIVTVSNGFVTAVKDGSTTVTATLKGMPNPAATVNVTVGKYPVERVDMSVEELYMGYTAPDAEVWKTKNLSAKVFPDTSSFRNLTWTTSDPSTVVFVVKEKKKVDGEEKEVDVENGTMKIWIMPGLEDL